MLLIIPGSPDGYSFRRGGAAGYGEHVRSYMGMIIKTMPAGPGRWRVYCILVIQWYRPGSPFDQPDVIIGFFCKGSTSLEVRNIRDRLKDMNGVFEKREHVGMSGADVRRVLNSREERGNIYQ
jgi:hypothetical protein